MEKRPTTRWVEGRAAGCGLCHTALAGRRVFARNAWGPHLASHILGRMAKIVPVYWQRIYAHPIYWLETFVDTSRFAGTCYRAANWQAIGTTQGGGHRAPTLA